MSGEQPDNNRKPADGAEKDDINPLEDLLVEEISEEARAEMAEALDGLVGITRHEHVITIQQGMDGLGIQHQVVAYVLGSYARDLIEHGHVTGSTNRVSADDLGAALGLHPADVRDHAMGHGDLRWYEGTSEVELPHERVRHAAHFLTRQREVPTFEEPEEPPEATNGSEQADVEAAVEESVPDGAADGGDEGGG